MPVYSTYLYNAEGYGDFIRSLLAVFVYCKENNIEHKLNIPNNPLNKCFDCITERLNYPIKGFIMGEKLDIQLMIDELNRCKDPNYNIILYSNVYTIVPLEKLKKYTSEFMAFLKLSDAVKQRMAVLRNQINNVEYVAMHIRCGDNFMDCEFQQDRSCSVVINPNQDILDRKLIKTIDFIKKNYNLPICLFTDVQFVKDRVCKQYDLLSFKTKIHHIAAHSNNVDAFIDVIAEFELMGEAKAIVKISYTGFAYWSAFIHNVPLFMCSDVTLMVEPFDSIVY